VKNFNRREFAVYFVVGGIATAIDWLVFAVVTLWCGFGHFIALIASMGSAGVFHYIANKQVAFKCESQQYGKQIFIYVLVALAGFILSFLILSGLIFLLDQKHAVFARMLTTLLMLVPNYLMHKYITFSRKIFA